MEPITHHNTFTHSNASSEQPITLYNTLSKQKERFIPLIPGTVSMYHCGPTVYNFVHIGNLRAFIVADTIRRLFEFNGYTVKQVMNITDIGHLQSDADNGEDKMTLALQREGLPLTRESMRVVAQKFYDAFRADLAQVHILPASLYPFASDHIADDIVSIQTLINTGYAYTTEDGIYFDTGALPSYGRLGGISQNESEVASRIDAPHQDTDQHTDTTSTHQRAKKNFKDFAIWKFNPELGYEASFGKGFPGWHIECSVMSMKYLGNTFDIHTGGIDHIAVHHNNEIAQSEALSHALLAQYWLHNEHVIIEGGKKMAKSGQSFITLADLEAHGISPLGYRYWLLGASYRTPIQFSYDAVLQAEKGYRSVIQKIAHLLSTYEQQVGSESPMQADTDTSESTKSDSSFDFSAIDFPITPLVQEQVLAFTSIINDDMHTAQAIAYLHEFVLGGDLSAGEALSVIKTCDHALGLDLISEAIQLYTRNRHPIDIPEHITHLAEQREHARSQKNWDEADLLRKKIESEGFNIIDTPDGYTLEKTLIY